MKAKKIFKGMTAAAVAAVLAASMVPMTAFAADAKITVNTSSIKSVASVGEIKAFKVAEKDSTSTTGWKWNTDVVDTTKLTGDNASFDKIDKYTGNATKQLAAELQKAIKSGVVGTDLTKNADTDTFSLANPAEGYYLLIVTPAENAAITYQPILVQVNAGEEKTISEVKYSEINIDKSITGVSSSIRNASGDSYDTNVAQVKIGDTINFQLKTRIPNYDPKIATNPDLLANFQPFTITDNPTNITLNRDTVKVYLSEDETLDILTDTKLDEGENNGYTLSFDASGNATIVLNSTGVVLKDGDITDSNPADGVSDYAGYYVFVTLDGTLAQGAVIEGAGNPNEAKVKFSNDYSTGSNSVEKDDNVKVYTTQLVINKLNNSEEKLQGAEFKIYQKDTENNEVIIASGTKATTDVNGQIKLTGLSAGTYYIQETKAPEGYKLDSTVKTFVINETSDNIAKTVTFEAGTDDITKETDDGFSMYIFNTPGSELPGTGGMGTIIFTVAGAGVVLVAGIMLIVYMKKRKIEE
mgnify:CR=1 FL=1